jgi:hypothetical protein
LLRPTWRREPGLFSAHDEQALARLREREPSFSPDVTLRIAVP